MKLLLSRWGVLSAEMATAIQADQSVVDKTSFTYPDNGGGTVDRDTIEVPFEEVNSDFVDDETGEIVED